ncbi:MAG: 4-hydroxy-tetrahydrodipicolinate reductase [Bacteroidales bacterium]|nr:4-hydroxy-tetrahydrodipicolinate reductase [Bacteroidales bacterium]
MRATIIGYGRMGHEIEKLLSTVGLELVTTIDNDQEWRERADVFRSSDVAIEFSTPATVISNLYRCFDAGVPVVCGTTGWYDQSEEVLAYCRRTSNALVYGSNFSIGANLFFKINELTAQLMNRQTQYDVMVEETHHTAKKDAPSGTAITTANLIINNLNRKTGWKLDDGSNASDIKVVAHRIGNEPGTHVVRYQSDNDYIEITHKAFNRTIFAQGAVRAARWLAGHKGIYSFKDIFMEI